MNQVTSLTKSLDILTLLGGSTGGFSVQELADAMNQPRSTVVRVLNTLVAYGLVEKTDRKYRCSVNFETWAHKDRHQLHIQRYRKTIEAVARETGELVLLGVQDGAGIIHIDYIECDQAVRVAPAPVTRHNIRRNAIGKLCIAQRPDLVEQWTQNDTDFADELNVIRETGIAWNREESVSGMIALACYGYNQMPTEPKIAVAWPTQRFTEKAADEAIKAIQSSTINSKYTP
ncbi:IclR family transcriptional regulator [Rubellicoccus peritrichatus]|uniref:Helix-turn-helix domain-containing protein n=1 Tax=Rubellicoccus peritrichatus TaxID=3080537 RepID=A0AAQ3LEN2_9BACT|nr:helix-turn-helix domain-containing protein [Puniceicoccus sp. CR14]WOO43194.1 helix-turn-helix domain-containing protein [Puniceicoccus sp. CR14]